MDVFERLAKKLDALPQGFPSTESGVELKILRTIFRPDEAEMALLMTPVPETAEDVAKRLGRPVLEIRSRLDVMARKGQIGSFKMGGQQVYRLFPFVVGIYEFQRRERLTKELAVLFEEYLPSLTQTSGGYGPHMTRVIPIHAKVKTDLRVLQHEDIRQIIEKAKSFRVQDCICRREQGLLGNRCKHTLRNCLQYSMEEHGFDYFNLDGDIITREEALKIMEDAEKEGLVHTTYNVLDAPMGFLCSCCSCCCGLQRALKEFHAPYALAKSNYLAQIDQESCIACGTCKDERCPMDAIVEEDGRYRVVEKRCIGCGVCVVTCPSESIKLIERPESDRDEIAKDMLDWGQRRMANRLRRSRS
jgi:Pyruvate/2-oxoacid:ferredoxin oxidoreductase delta subunit